SLPAARGTRGAPFAPGAVARRADDTARRLELQGAAERGRPERDLHRRLRVGRRGSAAPHTAEKVPKDPAEVLEIDGRAPAAAEPEVPEVEPVRPFGRLLDAGSRVAEPVIGLALLRVLQNLVRFLHFLELLLGRGVTRIDVGMELPRELPIRLL